MVLEATVLVIDNSEWMRNGDYTPTRIEAQQDAAILLFNAKTQTNPENSVGLMTMAGKNPNVLVTLTKDIGKVLTALHNVQLSGGVKVNIGVQIAQLILKHREHSHHHQRIIVFVGSPINEDEASLVTLGKKLKKNNIAIDVVSFGEDAENQTKLEAFIGAANNSDNSHLVTIPPGPHILSDILLSSPIISGEDGPPPGFSSGTGFEFGVDPSLDPELALALRISMEEERARQEKTVPASESPSKKVNAPPSASGGTLEDDMLAQALAMSVQGTEAHNDEDVEMVDEDEAMARAIAMSMGDDGGAMDSNFMSSMLQSLPGVDPNDPRIQSALKGDKKEPKDDSSK
ncbi:hypothetical protein BDV3_005188 [Batrachochytrium dendrobatidis]|nr:proteasome regulatory particle base subunit rpn10 [Batrachochytrium dendrobatidis]KAK5670597.1 proteasome regulatory particle base subunit rpn10 [Batrachochytrium dendrobatidis]